MLKIYTSMQSILANGYSIHFDKKKYEHLSDCIQRENYSKIFVLVDTNTNEKCLPNLLTQLATEISIEIVEIEQGENEKTIETCLELWRTLSELGGDRKSILINLGGGVITDLGGFVASTFKRGIDFINIPTTLLAMVDASIGGKNGVDLDNVKNQIGVINNPKMVLIDVEYLETLPKNQMRSGYAEMLKHGLIYDVSYWKKLTNLAQYNSEELENLIFRSVEIKNEIVLQDPKEVNARKALNFGHTIGHAIESYFIENPSKNNLLHGEAIAAGMIMESYIAHKKNLIQKEAFDEIKYYILEYFERINIDDNDQQRIIELMTFDKKNEYGEIQFALLKSIGNFITNQKADKELIIDAFSNYLS